MADIPYCHTCGRQIASPLGNPEQVEKEHREAGHDTEWRVINYE